LGSSFHAVLVKALRSGVAIPRNGAMFFMYFAAPSARTKSPLLDNAFLVAETTV
jgi:hypothetical protein